MPPRVIYAILQNSLVISVQAFEQMYEIDPARRDLVDEFMANPEGPHGPELKLLINRLRIMPMDERHVIICSKRGEEWMLAKLPSKRGDKVELLENQRFDLYSEAVKEVFRRRWQTVTGQTIS